MAELVPVDVRGAPALDGEYQPLELTNSPAGLRGRRACVVCDFLLYGQPAPEQRCAPENRRLDDARHRLDDRVPDPAVAERRHGHASRAGR